MSAPHFRPPNRLRTGRGVKFFFAAAEKSSHRASQKRRKLSAHFSRSSLTMPCRQQGKRAFGGFHGPIFPKNRLYRWKREAKNKENAGHAVTTTWDGSATTRDGSAATSRASQQAWAKTPKTAHGDTATKPFGFTPRTETLSGRDPTNRPIPHSHTGRRDMLPAGLYVERATPRSSHQTATLSAYSSKATVSTAKVSRYTAVESTS